MSPVGEWFMIILSQAPTLPSNDALLLRFQVLYSQYQRPTKRHDLHNPSRSRQSLSLVGTLCKQFVSAIDELLFSKLRFINMRLLSPVYRRILGQFIERQHLYRSGEIHGKTLQNHGTVCSMNGSKSRQIQVHSFRVFLQRLFKITTTQRRSQLQH